MPLVRARGFGLDWQADFPMGQYDLLPPTGEAADIVVRRVKHLRDREPVRKVNRGWVHKDGARFVWKDQAVFDMFDGERSRRVSSALRAMANRIK